MSTCCVHNAAGHRGRIGYLHQRLLQAGASSAVGADLSAKMLEVARAQAREQDLAERTDYREGDFVELAVQLLNHSVCGNRLPLR